MNGLTERGKTFFLKLLLEDHVIQTGKNVDRLKRRISRFRHTQTTTLSGLGQCYILYFVVFLFR